MKILAQLKTYRLNITSPPGNRVAIVVPLSSRPGFTEDERTSLRHLKRHLNAYDTFMIAPEGMAVEDTGYEVRRFDNRFFGSGTAHAALQMDPSFFETFLDYEYILMYHLDALVFSDELIKWCDTGWDYIGAPWLPCDATPWVTKPEVGNSGFTLFNVRSCLRVLYSPRATIKPIHNLIDHWRSGEPIKQKLAVTPCLIRKLLHHYNGVIKETSYFLEKKRASDLFWSRKAKYYYPDFKVATYEDGLQFAFETEPRWCLEQLGHMPFGCHAFEKYDRAFWEPYMISEAEMPFELARFNQSA